MPDDKTTLEAILTCTVFLLKHNGVMYLFIKSMENDLCTTVEAPAAKHPASDEIQIALTSILENLITEKLPKQTAKGH